MDLMKELIEERTDPHNTDVGTWRGKAQDAVKKLESVIGNVPGEDLDSDQYSRERAIKVTGFLKKYITKIEKDISEIGRI